MSQNSTQLPTTGTLGGLQGITDINAALDTLNTKWAGASAPATAEFGQSWLNTGVTPNVLNIYDGAEWVPIGTLDVANHMFVPALIPEPATGNETCLIRINAAGTAYETRSPNQTRADIGAAAAGANTDITSLGALSTPLAGFRNRIINGAMRFDQRGNGAAYSGPNGYTLDRHYVNRDGGVGNFTAQRVWENFGGAGTKFWLQLQRSSGDTSGQELSVFQPIEGQDCFDFWGETVTMSLEACAAGTGIGLGFTMELWWQGGSSDIGPNESGWTVITSPSFIMTGAPTRYSASFAVPAAARQVMARIHQTVAAGAAGSSETYYFTEWQLEPGPVATPFERRPMSLELAMCQRFYEVLTGFRIVINSGTNNYATWLFKVTKRASPSFAMGANSTYDAFDSAGIDGLTIYKGAAAAVIAQNSQAIAELT